VTIRQARGADRAAVIALLEAAGLPTAGIPSSMEAFLVAEDAGQVIGAIGLELYGGSALLRSAVVEAGRRRSGAVLPAVRVRAHRPNRGARPGAPVGRVPRGVPRVGGRHAPRGARVSAPMPDPAEAEGDAAARRAAFWDAEPVIGHRIDLLLSSESRVASRDSPNGTTRKRIGMTRTEIATIRQPIATTINRNTMTGAAIATIRQPT
jgi:hypothetical protein